jgi:hypothetical protein
VGKRRRSLSRESDDEDPNIRSFLLPRKQAFVEGTIRRQHLLPGQCFENVAAS